MRNWALFLHFYQPSTQNTELTKHILNASYLPVLDLLLQHPDQRFSVNISSTLLIQLAKIHANDFFDKVQILAGRNQIELVNSPVYHPLAPLVPWEVLTRQLQYDQTITHDILGLPLINGLFLSELAINHEVLENITNSTAYDWCLIDESSIHQPITLNTISTDKVMQIKDLALPVASRSLTEILRAYPSWINQKKLIDFIYQQTPENDTVISGNDVELFGHHYEERIHTLRELLGMSDRLRFISISDVVRESNPTQIELKDITPSSWQTNTKDLENGNPFNHWLQPDNNLQQKYQSLLVTAYNILSSVQKPENDIGLIYTSAEKHFDQGTASCYLYWLSHDPWWHPELVEIGAHELIKSVRTLNVETKLKRKAEEEYAAFTKALWEKHWSDEIKLHYNAYELERKKIITSLPDVS